jgi:hypothetical protein
MATPSTSPVKILTVEDCELRIKNCLDKLDALDVECTEEDELRLEAGIDIWEHVKKNIVEGATITLDANETFGYWPKQT